MFNINALTSLFISFFFINFAYSETLSDLVPGKEKQCSVQIPPDEKHPITPVFLKVKITDDGSVGLYAEAKKELESVQIIVGEKRLRFSSIEAFSVTDIKKHENWVVLLSQEKLYLTAKFNNGDYTSSTYNNLKNKDIFEFVKSKCPSFFSDKSIQYLIPPQYENATAFNNGVAVVQKGGLWGLIDKDNNWVVKPYYDQVGSYNDGYVGVMKKNSGNPLWGLLNYKGKLVQPLKYQGIGKCSQSRCSVKIDGKWGYLSPEEGVIIPAKLRQARNFREGFSAVNFNNKWMLINRSGKIFYKYNSAIIYSPSEGLFAVVEKGVKGKRGFVNLKGDVTIPPRFSWVSRFSDNLAAVRNDEGEWGYINQSGSLEIPYQYKSAKIFKEGLAPAQHKEGRWGFINKEGEWIISPKFNWAFPFKDGIATVRVNNPSDEGNPLRGFINIKGNFIYDPIFEDVYNFNEGTAPVKVSGKWGFIKKPDVK